MKSFGKTLLISILAILGLIVIWGISSYNGLISASEAVTRQQSNIETQLQRRSDLIPNLVETVKGYVGHEEKVIKDISDARAKLAGAGTMQEKASADTEISNALNRLLVVVEQYPDLKANASFIELQSQLEGTENRIGLARQDYNTEAEKYNQKVQKFPGVIFANMFGFKKVEYFKADEGSEKVPTVNFNQ